MAKMKVFTKNQKGKIEFTEKELESLLNEIYNDGYNDGKSRTYTWTSPYNPYTPYYYNTHNTTATPSKLEDQITWKTITPDKEGYITTTTGGYTAPSNECVNLKSPLKVTYNTEGECLNDR